MILSVGVFLMSHAIANETPPTLARFVDGDQSLQKLIEFPNVDGDVSITVFCELTVIASGELRDNFCYQTERGDRPFRIAVDAAVRLAKASPAVADGKSQTVKFHYRIVFYRKSGVTKLGVYSNWGDDVDKHGIDYEAPQRYSYDQIPDACRRALSRDSVRVSMLVGTDGALTGEVVFAPKLDRTMRNQRCAIAFKDIHKKAKYIPGHNGQTSIEATYAEVWSVIRF
jgi:hypothetical protein